MSPGMIGAVIGFVVGFMGFLFIRLAASRVEAKGVGPTPVNTARLLRMVALLDLILFTVIGYVIGPIIVTGATN